MFIGNRTDILIILVQEVCGFKWLLLKIFIYLKLSLPIVLAVSELTLLFPTCLISLSGTMNLIITWQHGVL